MFSSDVSQRVDGIRLSVLLEAATPARDDTVVGVEGAARSGQEFPRLEPLGQPNKGESVSRESESREQSPNGRP